MDNEAACLDGTIDSPTCGLAIQLQEQAAASRHGLAQPLKGLVIPGLVCCACVSLCVHLRHTEASHIYKGSTYETGATVPDALCLCLLCSPPQCETWGAYGLHRKVIMRHAVDGISNQQCRAADRQACAAADQPYSTKRNRTSTSRHAGGSCKVMLAAVLSGMHKSHECKVAGIFTALPPPSIEGMRQEGVKEIQQQEQHSSCPHTLQAGSSSDGNPAISAS